MNDKHKKMLEWQKHLCETGNAGYHKGQMVDIRINVNSERFTDEALKLMIINLNKKIND